VPKQFAGFSDFYPVYLKMHDHPTNRLLHVIGNFLGLAAIGAAAATRVWWFLAAAPVLVNGFAWVGHVAFQKNRPGVFGYPIYGTIGNWRMTFDVVTGRARIGR
jgi:hypothetical protein